MTLADNKALLVEAHRNQDWETARILSQQKQELKRAKRGRYNHCACGRTIQKHIQRCGLCYRLERYGKVLMETT